MKVTTEEIARHLGINRSTVSRALQGKLVSARTIERVRAAAEELGYQPNVGARIMATGRTGMYGLLIPRASNPYFGRVIDRMQALALEDGYHIALGCYLENFEEYARYVDLFARQRRVDGLIIFPMHAPRMIEPIVALPERHVPIVVMGECLNERVHWAGTNIEMGWYAMTRHLLDLGHRRIGAVIDLLGTGMTGQMTSIDRSLMPPGDGRHSGLVRALAERGEELAPDGLVLCASTLQGGLAAGRRLLDQNPRPTAIFAGNDLLAMGVIRAAQERGLRVPDDLSLAAYDNADYAELYDLTTVENLTDEIVGAPLRILRRVLEAKGEPIGQQSILLKPELVIRGSTIPYEG